MTTTYISSIRPDPSIRLSCNHFYHPPDSTYYDITPPSGNETHPIGWDRRYGVMFFSERAFLHGPFLIPSADEQYILCQMPKFTQERGKKCLYRIFEAYTAVEIGESGLRARLRDPATDQVYYFPSKYPDYVILSVLHFDRGSFSTCAVLVYKFRSAEKASQAFKMLTNTNSVPQRRGSPTPRELEAKPRIILTPSRSSPSRISRHRSPSNRALKDGNAQSRPRTRQIDIHSATQLQWDESSLDFGPRRQKVTIPVRISRVESIQRSNINKNLRPKQQLMNSNWHCIHCGHHSPDKNLKIHGNGASPGVGNGSIVIMNGKKYPWSMYPNVKEETGLMVPAYRINKMKASTDSDSSSSTSESSTYSRNTRESLDFVRNAAGENYSDESSSNTTESTVELVVDKRGNTPKVIGHETALNDRNGGRNGGGGNSETAIPLSRKGFSDSEEDLTDTNLISNGSGGLASPATVIGDGTTVYNLYRRQKMTGDDTDEAL